MLVKRKIEVLESFVIECSRDELGSIVDALATATDEDSAKTEAWDAYGNQLSRTLDHREVS